VLVASDLGRLLGLLLGPCASEQEGGARPAAIPTATQNAVPNASATSAAACGCRASGIRATTDVATSQGRLRRYLLNVCERVIWARTPSSYLPGTSAGSSV
jgi:hypothetical protein